VAWGEDWKERRVRNRNEGGFTGEKLSAFACPTNGCERCCLRVLAFPAGTAGERDE